MNPRRYHVIIDETALTIPLPDNTIMRDQLRHILTMAALPHITVQIMLRSAGPHGSRRCGFQLLSFPDMEGRDLLHVPHIAGESDIDDPDRIATARRLFDSLAALALSPRDSVRWIENLLITS
ncbi:hypothetical protein F0L68_23595 [Solihabitans fulvus]|uniref:DUF5753 domain-containing protein n=1 Tax=Solihabitans fulvus TaxID=1892852 RepID=A0A5B2X6T5_9PSEU|nr:hypothetical protein F0L68_23595 [Solihabitans fulvus]